MNKYFKNFILCSDVEHYCLLCQELFQCMPDVEKHIRWEKHRKNIKDQAYFPKFRKDFIYKVGNRFYCEICNITAVNIALLTEHINNENHKAMKNNDKTVPKNFIGQYDSGYIVIKKVIINMAQWNSIVNGKCHLCNIDVIHTDQHTASEEHIIKLIQSETIYEDERYYRKINEDKYLCFTCKKVYLVQNFHDHWSNCENIDEIEIKKLKESSSNKRIGTLSDNIEKKLIKTLQEFYSIDEKNNFAICKYCKNIVAINFKSMIEHMKNKHDNEKAKKNVSDESSEEEVVYMEVADNGKKRSDLAKYGKMHSIKLNFNGSKGWCFICDRYLSAHKNIFKEHVKGALHKGHLELQNVPIKNQKEHICQNYKSKSILQCSLKYAYEKQAFWIDSGYFIDVNSFFLLRPIENDPHFKKTKCYACGELFPQGQERDHCATPKHKNNFLASKVVEICENGEFVREIRPNLFHCGFCNQTYPYLEPLLKHMTCFKHFEGKYKGINEDKTNVCLKSLPTKTEDMYTQLLIIYGFVTGV